MRRRARVWRAGCTGNRSPGQNFWCWTWQAGQKFKGFGKTPSQHVDRGLFHDAIFGVISLGMMSKKKAGADLTPILMLSLD